MVLYCTEIAIIANTQPIAMKTFFQFMFKLLFRAVSMAEKYAINFSRPSPSEIQRRTINFQHLLCQPAVE